MGLNELLRFLPAIWGSGEQAGARPHVRNAIAASNLRSELVPQPAFTPVVQNI